MEIRLYSNDELKSIFDFASELVNDYKMLDMLDNKFGYIYDTLYNCRGLDLISSCLLDYYEQMTHIDYKKWCEIISIIADNRGDLFTSDREIISLFIAIENLFNEFGVVYGIK